MIFKLSLFQLAFSIFVSIVATYFTISNLHPLMDDAPKCSDTR